MKLSFLISILLFATSLWATPHLPQSPSADVLEQIAIHNLQQAENDRALAESFSSDEDDAYSAFRNPSVFPFAEYEKTGYLFFNDDDYRGNIAANIKRTIASNLPDDVTLVIYTTSTNQNYLSNLRADYTKYIADDQLMILQVPRSGSNSFWTRDNLPLPVWTEGQFTLVDAKYYYNFEPDAFLVNLFQSLTTKHHYFFEGGNFITNSRGECIVVNRRRSYPGGISDTAAIPDAIFKNQYGCKKLTRFKHLKGIGHADEVVKFMTDDIIVTDTEAYVPTLRKLGYKVHLLPEPDLNYETYANALQVNNVLFVPSFGEAGDKKAVAVYKNLNLGLKIVTIPTRSLATRGQGGIHCITMNYPPVPMDGLAQALKGRVVH